nr:DUF4861 family protein [Gemmatimonadaceae bacterium]
GPVRAIVEQRYDPWSGGGVTVAELKRISIDAGQNIYRSESVFQSDAGGDIPYAIGLVKRSGMHDTHSSEAEWAWLSGWGPVARRNGGHGELGTAVLLPRSRVKDWRETHNHYLAISRARSGETVVHYVGAGWTASGDFPDPQSWRAYLDNFARRLSSPIEVTLTTGVARSAHVAVTPAKAPISRLDSLTAHALEYSKAQLRKSATTLDPSNGFPRATRADGSWDQLRYNQWTSGFFAGTLWYMYHLDRDDEWKALAEKWTAGMEPAKSMRSTHDLGFMIYNSFGHGLSLTGNPHYREVVTEASRNLSSRYSPVVGAIKSWDTERRTDRRQTWKYPVIVDNLMNLELLFRSSARGDRQWREIAERHALTSARAHVRRDGSTAHVALFDPVTGRFERNDTWQGFSDSSAWARGQAWAIHGLAAAYANTGKKELLRSAISAANYFIAHLPADGIPYWDLLHPGIPNVERDASAAAIAASGLLELSRHTKGAESQRFRRNAERIIGSLSAAYLTEGTGSQAILAHSVGNRPHNGEVDVGLVYADYYFVEALLRLKGIYWR